MSSNSNFFLLGAAVFGIVSAAGMFIVEHFMQDRRRHAMAQEMARLDRQVGCLQKELEQLRNAQKQSVKFKKKFPPRNTSSASNLSSYSCESSQEVDSSDLEFYDLSDDEESTLSTITLLEQLLQGIDVDLNALDAFKVKQAYDSLKQLNVEYPNNSEILWHLGKAYYKMVLTTEDPTIKEELIAKGIQMCEAALGIKVTADAHKWLAILIGVRSNSQSIQGKISDGYLFKKHIDAAIAIDSKDPTLHHMLGQFAYASASLKWYERKVAATFFSEPPSGTFDEALDHFCLAEDLMLTDWKENKLFIGKCLIALGRYKEAVKALTLADAMPNSLDNEIAAEVKVLLQKYNNYR